jgi:F plasmid transfer operon, TraF, protein
MRKATTFVSQVCLPVVFVTFTGAPAAAQIYESVGIRAQGMAGAFVAVADDADATWWNPAGLASGAYFSGITEFGNAQDPADATGPGGLALPSWRSGARGFTITIPSLGLSYYRLQVSQIQPFGTTAPNSGDRQDQGRAPVASSSLVLQEFGVTVGQSIGRHFVIGTTARFARLGGAVATGDPADASLDRAEDLDRGDTDNEFDLDVGAMAAFNGLRLALVVKHVTEPSFSSGGLLTELPRQARAGVSVTGGRGAAGQLTVAFDADLTRTPTATGEVRHIAAGAETWLVGRRVGVRGGVTANTIGDARLSGSLGASGALRKGTYVDAQLTGGSDRSIKGWGVALRVTY